MLYFNSKIDVAFIFTLSKSQMNFEHVNIPEKLVPDNYLQLGLAAQRSKQRSFKELLEKVIKPKLNPN